MVTVAPGAPDDTTVTISQGTGTATLADNNLAAPPYTIAVVSGGGAGGTVITIAVPAGPNGTAPTIVQLDPDTNTWVPLDDTSEVDVHENDDGTRTVSAEIDGSGQFSVVLQPRVAEIANPLEDITLDHGDARAFVPAAAVAPGLEVSLSPHRGAEIDRSHLVGRAWELAPTETTLTPAGTVAIRVPSGVAADSVQLSRWDETTLQ